MGSKETPIDNSEDLIDSRDVIERIAFLQRPDADLDEDEADELSKLLALQEACDGNSEWKHGVTLIRDSYFIDYAKDFAEDMGAIDRESGWPACHIDWKAAAESLQMDYQQIDFDGETYWAR